MNDYSKSWPLPPVSVALTHATNCAQCQSGWLNKSADQGSSGGVSTSGLSDQPTTFRMIVWRTVLAAGLVGLLAGGRPSGRVELYRFDTRQNLLDWWPDQRCESLWFGSISRWVVPRLSQLSRRSADPSICGLNRTKFTGTLATAARTD